MCPRGRPRGLHLCSIHQLRLPLLAPEALCLARAQTTPLGLTVIRTNHGPQSGSMVRSAAGTKHCYH